MKLTSNKVDFIVTILSVFTGVEFIGFVLYVAFSIAISAARIY